MRVGVLNRVNLDDIDAVPRLIEETIAKKEDIDMTGETISDVELLDFEQIQPQCDPLLQRTLKEMLQFDEGKQKETLNLASNLIYDTCELRFEDDEMVSVHGSNFKQSICPFPLIVDLDFLNLLKTYEPDVVTGTISNLLDDPTFTGNASDYQMLLFIAFSKYGYFCGESKPLNEDWGELVVESVDQQITLVKNSLPKRRVHKCDKMALVQTICQGIIIKMLGRTYIEE